MDCYSSLDDQELLHRLKAGEENAFTEIYNRYWKSLFAVAFHKLRNHTQAEEIVQDIFMNIWKRREVLEITSTLSAYLAVCVKYKVINVLAKRNQQLQYVQFATNYFTAADSSTEQWIQFEELKEQLAKETAQLPEKCRLVFQLSREKGLSQKQIAHQLGISEKTVESHLSKALRTLRSSLGQLFSFMF